MCGIFGLGFLKGHKVKDDNMMKDVVKKLFLATEERGWTASGIAYTTLHDIHVAKNDLRATKFVTTDQYKETENLLSSLGKKESYGINPVLSIIGHCRLMTKGTERNNVNNHPIVRDLIVGVHNGIIQNDDHIFNIYETYIKRNGQVDSEAIFALIEYFSDSSTERTKTMKEAIKASLMILQGSASCAFVDRRQPGLVWLFKRHTPCDVVIFKKIGVVAWASRKDYIEQATSKHCSAFGKPEDIEYKEGSGVCLDFFRNKIFKFKL